MSGPAGPSATGRGIALRISDLWFREGATGAGTVAATTALAPAEAAFRLAVAVRNAWHDRRRPEPAPLPVVSVGNLTVGGTGKTPVVRWLRDWLAGRGARVAVVSRGYGGDETALYRRWFGPDAVFAGPNRATGVRSARAAGHRLAILDDGFQHRRLARDLDVLLVAAEDPVPVRLLPRGPYREPLSSAQRAGHVLLTRRVAPVAAARAWRKALARAAPHVPVAEVQMEMGGWTDLAGDPVAAPTDDVLAVCAVGRPRAFASGLRRLLPDSTVELAAFRDHHAYRPRDVTALLSRRAGRAIVCTAKDAVKLARFPQIFPHCTVAGLRVAGRPSGPLREALAQLAESA